MPGGTQRYEVISVSLPRDLVRRADALIPKKRRSRVIAGVLTNFLDVIERKRLEDQYRAYYTERSPQEVREERDLVAEWEPSDQEAWAILEKEESRGRRPPR